MNSNTLDQPNDSLIPNERLRQFRLQRGWTLQEVADRLYELLQQEESSSSRKSGINADTVGRWERGVSRPSPRYRAQLRTLFAASDEELGFTDVGKNEEGDVKRRDAIKTLGAVGASVVVGISSLSPTQEIDRLIARRLARLQSWVVDGLEDGTHLRWQLYYTSNNTLTEDGLRSQIERLEQLADDGGDHYRRVCRILAQNYQLAGTLARDRFQYTKAMEYFHKAERLDQDVQLPDLTAASLARQAVALLRKDPERYLSQSLVLYRGASDRAKHAEPYTRAYVLSGYAEALARNGNYDECLKALDQAETLLSNSQNIPIEEDFAYVQLSLQSLADSRGECYVLLGKPEEGLEYLQTAQKKLDQRMSRNSCRLLMQQAEAYLASSQPDACVQQALKGLEIARVLESTSNVYWASEILAKLRSSAWKREPIIDELEEAIRD